MSLAKTVAFLKSHDNFLISAHVNLEGDAIGSELAFLRLLTKLGKRAVIINDDPVPEAYAFLPQSEKARQLNRYSQRLRFDCFAALDCSDLSRTGSVAKLDLSHKPILNIDHHISNGYFGQVNWVMPEASSCSEMIYLLYKKMQVPFDPESALNLYVGIMTDTGSFRYANTSTLTHQAASELIKFGVDVNEAYRNVYETIPYVDLKLLMSLLPHLKRAGAGRVAYFEVERSFEKQALSFDLSEHLLSFARSLKGAEVALVFKENLGPRREVRVNLRSRGNLDVNAVAKVFGGGGHRRASGCTIAGDIAHARRMVLAEIKRRMR